MNSEIYRMKQLIDKLNEYTKYYDLGTPKITDEEYDKLYFSLVELEKETGITYPNSPTQSIHFEIVSELPKKPHDFKPMLSLDKTKEVNEIEKFVKGQDWMAMFKLDGLSVRLTYDDGELIGAETRGNGIEGEWIYHNALVIDNIPKHIPNKELTIIDGEAICRWTDFNEYFSEEYSHPRNFAAGSIRQLSSKEAASRKLKFIAWDLIKGCDDIDFFFWRLEKLDDWGFDTVPRVGDTETVADAIEYLDKMQTEYDYPIDGYVFRFESQKYYNNLGNTGHHFRGAMAFKFYDEEYETELLDIEWSMGRTGVLTPVAIYEDVDIDGTICNRASLHNLSIMRETLGQYPEKKQKIWIAKMNQIIPQITKAEKNDIPHDHVLDSYPIFCPICGEETKIEKSESGVLNIMCGNPACEGKLENRIDHYLGKKGLDVKGISKMTIRKLIEWGWVQHTIDIYLLDMYRDMWINKPGFGVASVDKILNAIEESKHNVVLADYISALGIPLVGKTIAKEITKYYETWKDFREAIGGDWTEFEGFGPEIRKAINNFDYKEADKIAEQLEFAETQVRDLEPAAAIKDKTFVITGKMVNYTNRDLLKAEIESLGGRVVGSISSITDYLINNDINSTSSKNRKAKELGIPIISEEEYIKMKS